MNGELRPTSALAARAVALAATGLLLAGYTEAAAMHRDPLLAAMAELPPAACERPTADDTEAAARQKAERCEQAREHGRLALVNFDGDPGVATTIEDKIGGMLSQATEGRVRLAVTPIQASPAAKAALKKLHGADNCVQAKPEQLAATIADTTMPMLKDYDFVMALTTEPSCRPAIAGFTYGRHSDIYGVTREAALGFPGRRGYILGNAAHEAGHLEGANHFAVAGRLMGGKEPDPPHGLENTGIALGDLVDLRQYLQGSDIHYNEYRQGTNIMGTLVDAQHITPDAAQMALFDWPEVVLGKKADAAEPVGAVPLHFTEASAEAGAVAAMQLDKPVAFKDGVLLRSGHIPDDVHQFDELLIEPHFADDPAVGVNNVGVEVMLGNRDGTIVDLGLLVTPIEGAAKSTITCGNQHVEVTTTSTTTTIQG
jgi:hypothetical protein